MSYFGNLMSAILGREAGPKAQTFNVGSMTEDQVQEFIRTGGGYESASGISINEHAAMRVATNWRCVNIIAGTMGSTPIDLVRRVDEKTRAPAIGHPLRKVLTIKPNQWQTPKEFRTMLQSHLLMRGNGYARKVRSGGEVIGLLPMHPDRVRAHQLDDLTMEYEIRLTNGQYRKLSQRDVLHLRGLSLDGVAGLSVLSYMREALGISLQSERASARMMKRGTFTPGYLKHPSKLGDEAHERLKSDWRDTYGGAENAGNTPVLEEGLTYEVLDMSAQDMQFLEQRDFQRYDIAMFYGVPPHMVGALSKSTSWGSGLEQQAIGFVTYTMLDWFRTWEEAIKRDLIAEREWETVDARFFPQGLMRGDSKAREAFYRSGLQWGWMSPNEVRALEDMNPREGGDIYYPPPNTAGGDEQTADPPQDPTKED